MRPKLLFFDRIYYNELDNYTKDDKDINENYYFGYYFVINKH